MPKKLLLADDSITIQKVVGITLANEDLEIISVDNGEDAIARARAIRPDMVLADASMPKKDGYQVAEALKSDPATAGIPVIILAGQLEGHPDQARLAACRADGFIPKPFESATLIERVRKVLGLTGPAVRTTPPPRTAPPPVAANAVTRPSSPLPPPPMPPSQVSRPAQTVPPPGIPAGMSAVTMPSPRVPMPVPLPPPAPLPPPTPVAMQPIPQPIPQPTFAVPADTVPSIDEADFGDLSGAPAASGDQDLWGGEVPLTHPTDENLWVEPTPNPATNGGSPGLLEVPPEMQEETVHEDTPQFVTNAAELANLEHFAADASPSGLDLDDTVRTPPRREEARREEAPREEAPPPAAPSAAVDLAAQITPEKLEAAVRDAVARLIGPILEKIAWEVVPDLAEDIIRDEIKRLLSEKTKAAGPSKTGTA
jgi:CheY-like chemotaxis protein